MNQKQSGRAHFDLAAAALASCLLLGLAAPAAQAEVWKCKVGDKVHYSDQPCPVHGDPLPARQLQPNVVAPVKLAPAEPGASAAGVEAPFRPGNVCPSDAEIRAMETRLSSISYEREEKDFLGDEVRRARQCRKGQGRYTAEDWDISRQAQSAQSNLSGAADARRRAEAMHSAADANEGERIARQRQSEEEGRRRHQLRRERPERPLGHVQAPAPTPAAVPPSPPTPPASAPTRWR